MAFIRTLASAGIKRSKGSFLGLFFLMALTSTALCFTLSLYVDLNVREEMALAEAGAGDVYAYDLASNLTDDVIFEIESIDGVASAETNEALSIPSQYLASEGAVDHNPTTTTLYAAWGEGLDYRVFADDRASLVDNPQAPGTDEVYAPISFLVSPGVDIGDTVELKMGDRTKTLTIAGFIEDPQIGTPFMESKRLIMDPNTFDELADTVDSLAYEQGTPKDVFTAAQIPCRLVELNVTMTDEARATGMTPNDLTHMIAEETAWGASTSGMFSATTLAGYAMIVVIIGSAIMAVFALMLFVVALVICTHTISSSIEKDYADYGTLKALGVPNRALARVLVIEYAGTSLIGLAVGLIASMALVPLGLPFFAQLTGILANNNAVPLASMACLGALMALVLAVIAWKARKLGAIFPLVAFRSGKADVHFKSRASRTVSGSCLNLELAVRSVLSAKRRYVGLLACSILMCAFIVLIFGIGGALREPGAVYDAFGMWKSDLSAVAATADDALDFDEVDSIVEQTAGIKNTWQESFTMVNLSGESRSFVGLSDPTIPLGIAEGRAPKLDNEVLVGMNLASAKELEIGDEFPVTSPDGTEHMLIVCGKLSAMFNAGYGCILTFDGLCSTFGMDATDPAIGHQYTLDDPAKIDEVKATLEARFGDRIDLRASGLFSNTSTIIELIQMLFTTMGYIMAAIAAALVFLAVSLIIGRMFLVERQDLGVYRALGFTSTRLRVQFALRFFLVALAGCALGALATSLGGSWLASQLFGMFGVTQFAIDTNPVMVCGLTLGLALVFLAAAYVSARKVKRIDVRELVMD
ncbi:ABC transporter permease [Raoultibacter phocaeensis]|uniref:ABC transporter permease n=1 Tax=Raoultibacter phocaeensis TaxID=2479841 RepID=UPI00111BB45E|nr:ABC transporter permease [Raoultibacter phocaeensis]